MKFLSGIPAAWWVAPAGGVAALLFAWHFYRWMMRVPEGTDRMKEISGYVRQGAMAYLSQQYKMVGLIIVLLAVVLGGMAHFFGLQSPFVPFAFLSGAFFSGLAGYLGMRTATQASHRTAQAASESLDAGLKVAFRSGAVMGLLVVGLALLDTAAKFFILKHWPTPIPLHEITIIMLAGGMGASTVALFARVGGGIYTKAADVGADLVGKVEAGIPEDDPRNPATIADNVGDNVGDVAGMGADLYESYAASILAASALGVGAGLDLWGVLAPQLIAGVGIFLSLLGIYWVRAEEGADQMVLLAALRKGIWGASALIAVAIGGVLWHAFGDAAPGTLGPLGFWGLWLATITGLVAGLGISYFTEYYTSFDYAPTQQIAKNAETGPATVIIHGIATGLMSTGAPLLCVVLGMLLSFGFAGGFDNLRMGLFGVGLAAVGLLSPLAITLATDAYGPIADNAGGNAEMSHLPPHVRKRTDLLDSLGNTTAATGKGFAIGSAALTALALLSAYMEEVKLKLDGNLVPVAQARFKEGDRVVALRDGDRDRIPAAAVAEDPARWLGTDTRVVRLQGHTWWSAELLGKANVADLMSGYDVTLMNPGVLSGLLLGGMLAFVFCALTMKAVGRAAAEMVEEVRRQFREKPGILEGKDLPDYARCVAISTAGAQRQMVVPSMLAIVAPIAVGLLLGVAAVMGLMVGAIVCGFMLAVMMANAGGAWDNAKKYIEAGHHGGKGSPAHKAAVTGDTVGDPFKDTSGPSLNILIKLLAMVSIVFSGIAVTLGPRAMQFLGM